MFACWVLAYFAYVNRQFLSLFLLCGCHFLYLIYCECSSLSLTLLFKLSPTVIPFVNLFASVITTCLIVLMVGRNCEGILKINLCLCLLNWHPLKCSLMWVLLGWYSGLSICNSYFKWQLEPGCRSGHCFIWHQRHFWYCNLNEYRSQYPKGLCCLHAFLNMISSLNPKHFSSVVLQLTMQVSSVFHCNFSAVEESRKQGLERLMLTA